jgi:hypothetical protein
MASAGRSRPQLLGISLIALAACAPDTDDTAVMRAATADTLIRASDAILGSPVDLAVAGDGRVWIADPQNHRIAVWNPADRSLTTVGREGDGPGELRDPQALVVTGGSILVLQPQAGRLSEFSERGEFMGSRNIGSGMILPLHISADSVVAGPSLGQDGTLVTVLDLQSGERTLIGRAFADRPQVMSMRAIRDQALRGEFPVEFRNNVVAVAHRGAAWIISQYRGQIIHLTATDDTVWAATLPAAVIEDAHAEYFAAVETEPGRIRVPAIATDAQVLNNTLVVSIRTRSGSALWSYDAESGRELGRLELPGLAAGPFAVDLERQRTYVALPDDATLIALDSIPAGVRPRT